ncbi:MAG: hypothetical protein KDB06_01465 [Ilumatobacter sp.]|nr:hypothetical protein [Ilumatobacter sp.]MCB0983299.1 hypothetical protein [Ilumatobacter sp.]
MGTSARRSGTWWEARYAKSQERVEQARRAASAEELPIPYVPAVSTVTGPDGTEYMLRLIPPGEPLDRVGRFAATAMLSALLLGGLITHEADNLWWIAVVERQRGPWRGFERADVRKFEHYADAAHFLQSVRHDVEASATQ